MANLAAKHGALDMDNLGLTLDGTMQASPSDIRIKFDTVNYLDFFGSFHFGAGGSVSGTVTGIQNTVDDTTTFTLDGANADAQTLFGLVQAGDIRGAEAYVLRDDDRIDGGDKGDTLYGFAGDDDIHGGSGRDTLAGGEGRDHLRGDGGGDTFAYWSAEDSGIKPGERDTIFGFNHKQGDMIDLRAIDANQNTGENEAFTVVDHFSGVAGELVIKAVHGGYLVQANTDGHHGADFSILVKSDAPLIPDDLRL